MLLKQIKLKKILSRVRVHIFPTELEKEVKRWYRSDPDESLRFDYELDDSSLVLDLGGYKGQWASDIYSRFNATIFVFEPVIVFAKNIERRFAKNKKIKVFPYALGATSRQETIYMNNDGTSLFVDSTDHEIIQIKSIENFFEKHDIKFVDLLKINIEGGEYEVLPNLIETGLIKRIKNLQIQFHEINSDSENKMRQIQDLLSLTHKSTFQYRFVWENWTLK